MKGELIGRVVAMRYGTERKDAAGNGLMFCYGHSTNPVYLGQRADGEKTSWNETLVREATPDEIAHYINQLQHEVKKQQTEMLVEIPQTAWLEFPADCPDEGYESKVYSGTMVVKVPYYDDRGMTQLVLNRTTERDAKDRVIFR